MKPERRKKVVSIADVHSQDGANSWFHKYGNSLLTGLLIAAAVALLVRWRLSTAAAAKQAILSELASARSLVDQLHSADSMGGPADLIRNVQAVESDANSKLSDVLNTSDDASLRAQALVIRGDLYWQLANLPPLPGATTQPSLNLRSKPDQLLKQAEDAYISVVNTPEFAVVHDAVNSARLGLAAIAENRNDWVTATKQFDAVKEDPFASGEKVAAANIQLSMITNPVNSIQDPTYVAPPSGTPPTTLPAMGPVLPTTLPVTPTTLPRIATTLQAATLPTTHPQ
jgi:hypothetical protein